MPFNYNMSCKIVTNFKYPTFEMNDQLPDMPLLTLLIIPGSFYPSYT